MLHVQFCLRAVSYVYISNFVFVLCSAVKQSCLFISCNAIVTGSSRLAGEGPNRREERRERRRYEELIPTTKKKGASTANPESRAGR